MTEQAVEPAVASMRLEVWRGLNGRPRELSPRWFYDARGSALFDEITRLDEYYPTRTERAILASFGCAWFRSIDARSLVELGPGSAEKTAILVAVMRPGDVYVPVDISESFLDAIARGFAEEYPHLEVRPALADITRGLDVPADLPAPTVFAFLGSTIGNFERDAATRLLRRIRAAMKADDRLLMGADLVKDTAVIERAYNDARGVTAEFNRNILRVLNREIDTDFDPSAWSHRAFFNATARRIEMHLVADSDQTVTVPGLGTLTIGAGESIRTEISCKYDRASVAEMFAAAGLEMERWVTDERNWFALAVARPGD